MKQGIFYSYPDKYKASISFAAVIKPIISEEQDKYLALASENLKKFLPDIDINKNYDLLPFSCNAFVSNRANSNDDAVFTTEAVEIAKMFPYKFVDFSHERNKIIGTILTASFSEFGTDKLLDGAKIKENKGPFNVTLGGVLWRVINEDFIDSLEKFTEPDSKEQIAASWELAFSDYKLVLLPRGKKNLEDGKTISDASEISNLESKMKCFGGKGFTDDGFRIIRVPVGDVNPLGIGLVSNPAGEVGSIVVKEDNKEEKSKDETNAKNPEIIQVLSVSNIDKQNTDSNLKTMKLNNVEDIKKLTDENLKECKASDINSVLDTEVKRISDEWEKKNKQLATLKTEVEDKNKELEASNTKTIKDLAEVRAELNKLVEAAKIKEKEEKYNARMEDLDNKFDLSKEDRAILASRIKDMDDEGYKKYSEEMDVLLAAKKKSAKKPDPEDDPDEKEPDDDADDMKDKKNKKSKKNAKASDEDPETVVANAIDKGEKDKTAVANTIAAESTLADQYKVAFGPDNWEVKTRRKRV